MGSLGVDVFENDTAWEWLGRLDDDEDEDVEDDLAEAVAAIAGGDVGDAYDAHDALVVGELLAAVGGRPRKDLPEEGRRWARRAGTPALEVLRLARTAVELVRDGSPDLMHAELEDGATPGERREWQRQIDDLLARLDQAIADPPPPRPPRPKAPSASPTVRVW